LTPSPRTSHRRSIIASTSCMSTVSVTSSSSV
jgi:hypothetical protein